ncbi:MAG: hypothetical protein M3063_13240 [Actinomycetota bacterium]|nr:hypothetical protein [Actinomycetota bacterium]
MAERPVGKRRFTGDTPGADPAPGPEAATAGVTAEADHEDLDEADRTALPPRVESWRKRSATGAILTGFALGLQQVFEPERKEPAIMMETSGEPPRDLPVEAELELATTRRSVVKIRPWLLDEDLDGVVSDADHPGVAGVAPRARRRRRLRKRKR